MDILEINSSLHSIKDNIECKENLLENIQQELMLKKDNKEINKEKYMASELESLKNQYKKSNLIPKESAILEKKTKVEVEYKKNVESNKMESIIKKLNKDIDVDYSDLQSKSEELLKTCTKEFLDFTKSNVKFNSLGNVTEDMKNLISVCDKRLKAKKNTGITLRLLKSLQTSEGNMYDTSQKRILFLLGSVIFITLSTFLLPIVFIRSYSSSKGNINLYKKSASLIKSIEREKKSIEDKAKSIHEKTMDEINNKNNKNMKEIEVSLDELYSGIQVELSELKVEDIKISAFEERYLSDIMSLENTILTLEEEIKELKLSLLSQQDLYDKHVEEGRISKAKAIELLLKPTISKTYTGNLEIKFSEKGISLNIENKPVILSYNNNQEFENIVAWVIFSAFKLISPKFLYIDIVDLVTMGGRSSIFTGEVSPVKIHATKESASAFYKTLEDDILSRVSKIMEFRSNVNDYNEIQMAEESLPLSKRIVIVRDNELSNLTLLDKLKNQGCSCGVYLIWLAGESLFDKSITDLFDKDFDYYSVQKFGSNIVRDTLAHARGFLTKENS